ncbi:unnamed protein product, partial [Adineta steineri]
MAEPAKKDAKKGREPKNQVHQEAILVETIRKEMAEQKLFTNYSAGQDVPECLKQHMPNTSGLKSGFVGRNAD